MVSGEQGAQVTGRAGTWLMLGRAAGALLTAAMGGIHLVLWFDGFRDIDIIGVLFLLNAAGAAVLAVALVAAPRRQLAALEILARGRRRHA